MSAVKGFFSSVWSYGVALPLYLIWGTLVGIANGLLPRGYKPCNELADAFMTECASQPAGKSRRLPWIDSSATETVSLNDSGRLLAYTAIASRWFGLAVKETGAGYAAKRAYRYYYRREFAGNWFAEIWSVPKSGFIAALLALPFVDMARDVMRGAAAGHEGAFLLIAGVLLVLAFMPRALLGSGIHYAAIAPINGGSFGGYGCAQIINWAAGLGGVSFLWLATGVEWNFSAAAGKVSDVAAHLWWMTVNEYEQDGLLMTVVMTPVAAIGGALFGMAWTILPAAFLWYASLRFIAARKAKARLELLNYNAIQAAMYSGSDFERAAELRAPQVFLGYLVYLGVLLGVVLYPISSYFISLF